MYKGPKLLIYYQLCNRSLLCSHACKVVYPPCTTMSIAFNNHKAGPYYLLQLIAPELVEITSFQLSVIRKEDIRLTVDLLEVPQHFAGPRQTTLSRGNCVM